MVADVSIAVVKLLLGLLVFAGVGYIGKFYDKRIAGVLLTFPILNGIGILTGSDPLAVANSIYAVVVVNGIVLFLMIAWCDRLPPLASAPPNVKLVVRLIVWAGVWAVFAPLAILWRNDLPGAGGLLLAQFVIVIAAGVLFWQPKVRGLRESADGPEAPTWRHAEAFIAFWRTRDCIKRLLLFTACSTLLLAAALVTTSQWLGMLSALPVPGLFAVATLSIIEKRDYFERMRDTVLLGPISVIAFNWIYAHVVLHLPAGIFARPASGIAVMALLLFADAVFIFWSTPLVTRLFDRLHAAHP